MRVLYGSKQIVTGLGCIDDGWSWILRRRLVAAAFGIILSAAPVTTLADYPLRQGGVLSESCLSEGMRFRFRAETIARVEGAIDLALRRSQDCAMRLGLGDMIRVQEVLRELTIHCELSPSQTAAYLRTTLPVQTAQGVVSVSPFQTRDFRLYFNSTPASPEGRAQFDLLPIEELAMVVAHESLHAFANSRIWHSDSVPRATSGCVNSLFEDRIYFQSGACFPNTRIGRFFYDQESGAARCPQVCVAALTQVDSGTLHRYADVQGPSLIASPLEMREAEQICRTIPRMGLVDSP